jgi:arylformamidase
MNNWIDATQSLQEGMVYWPGQDAPKFKQVASLIKGDMANLTQLSLSAHTGTHMDAPLHFVDGTKDISEMPLEAMTGDARVFEIMTGKNITKDDLISAEKRQGKIIKGDKILFKTKFSITNWTLEPFKEFYPALSRDAAEYLTEKEIMVVGIDYLSIAPFDNLVEIHEILLKKGIWVIEGLNLNQVEEGSYDIIATPLKIKGSDGSPARVLLKKKI